MEGSKDNGTPTAGGRPVRPPSLLDALIPAFALIGLLALSFILFGDAASSGPNQVALLFCGIIAAGIGFKNGMSWEGIRQGVVDGRLARHGFDPAHHPRSGRAEAGPEGLSRAAVSSRRR